MDAVQKQLALSRLSLKRSSTEPSTLYATIIPTLVTFLQKQSRDKGYTVLYTEGCHTWQNPQSVPAFFVTHSGSISLAALAGRVLSLRNIIARGLYKLREHSYCVYTGAGRARENEASEFALSRPTVELDILPALVKGRLLKKLMNPQRWPCIERSYRNGPSHRKTRQDFAPVRDSHGRVRFPGNIEARS
jgi:hypothetical protein